MKHQTRLALALFRTSWLRSLATVLGLAAAIGIATSVVLVIRAFNVSADEQLAGIFATHDASSAALPMLRSRRPKSNCFPSSRGHVR